MLGARLIRLNLVTIVYAVVGVVLASNRHYFSSLDTASRIGSAILAVVLWPLLLLGFDLHVRA